MSGEFVAALVGAVGGLAIGFFFGYEFAIRRAEAWIEDHIATDHSGDPA